MRLIDDGLTSFRFEIPDVVMLDPAMACIDAPRVPLSEWAAAELSKDPRCDYQVHRLCNAFVTVIEGRGTRAAIESAGRVVAEHDPPFKIPKDWS